MQPIGEVHRAACPPRRLRPPEGRDVIGGFVVGRNLEQLDAARAPAAHGLHPQAGTAFVPRFEIIIGFKRPAPLHQAAALRRSEEHTSELQSLMRISYAVFCLKKKNIYKKPHES